MCSLMLRREKDELRYHFTRSLVVKHDMQKQFGIIAHTLDVWNDILILIFEDEESRKKFIEAIGDLIENSTEL